MANIITSFRIVCAVILLFCPTFSSGFTAFYLLGGVSDALDGVVARHFGHESALGARLDTAADTVFTAVVLIKVLRAVFIPRWLLLWIGGIALLKVINAVSGFRRSGHFVAEHTPLNKVCGLFLFAIPLCTGRFPWQNVAVLIILTCALATAAAVQEGHCIRAGKEIR